MSPISLAAIDIGTTLIKAGIFTEAGELAGVASQPFDLASPREGWFELPPEACWRAICRAIRNAVRKANIGAKQIAAVGLSSQGQTVIPVDANGEPLADFIVWHDRRAAAEAAEIESHFGGDRVYEETGVSKIVPGHTASVLLWWRRNRPEIFSTASRFLLTKDYAIFRMTGGAFIDRQLAASTAFYSAIHDCWWDDLIEFIGLDSARLSALCSPDAIVGELIPSAAEDIGLPAGCPVVAGTWDQIAGAIGAGNVRPGTVSEMTGSCLAIFATCNDFIIDPKRRMLAGRHAIGRYGYLLPYTEFAGRALQRVRNERYGETIPYQKITAGAASIPIGCNGLVMDLGRTGTVSDIRDAFVNLSGNHTRAHMARAAMEAVAFSLKDHVDALTEMGVEVESIIALGGGARSDMWLQMKADLLGMPVKRPVCTEAALLGAAILAGRGRGMFDDIVETAGRLVKIEQVFEPDRSIRLPYRRAHERSWKALRNNISTIRPNGSSFN